MTAYVQVLWNRYVASRLNSRKLWVAVAAFTEAMRQNQHVAAAVVAAVYMLAQGYTDAHA